MKPNNNVIIYPSSSIERKLGMDVVRRHISQHCVSEPARELVDAMCVTTDFNNLSAELERTSQMCAVLDGERNFSLSGFSDTRAWLAALRANGSFIDTALFGALRRSLQAAADVAAFFAVEDNPTPRLAELAAGMAEVGPVIRTIDDILDPAGNVRDNASPELRDIRSRLSTIAGRISGAIRRVLSRAVADGLVDADTQPAVRDGRLVLPVAAMNKRRLPGIVHDESSTGKTYFIEPAEVVELNNEQRELEIDERREIIRILTRVADTIRPELPALGHTFGIMAQFDFIRAKAMFARSVGGTMPRLVDRPLALWHDARHPALILTLAAQGRHVVPMDLELSPDSAHILVVSGPNAGGKSVTLKTTGIIQYMTQCGVLPSLDPRSTVGIFDNIFVDLGDDQSIEDDLSTYSSHLSNMKFFLNHGNNRTLFLIDEFGAGTEPRIGGAIAASLLSHFNNMSMWGVVTTHYQSLKQLAEETDGMVNGSMMYDRAKMTPTFRLATGHPGSSFAVDIARRIGLPASIIDEAENIVGSDYFNLDKYLLDISRDRRYWENKRADIRRREKHLEEVIARYEENAETLRKQRRAILDEAKTQADDIIARSNAAVERTIHEIRRSQADKEETRAVRARLNDERHAISTEEPLENVELSRAPRPKKNRKQHVEKPVATQSTPLKPGDNVLLDNQGQPGTVIEISGNKAIVSFGLMKMTVPLDRLTRTMRQVAKAAQTTSVMSRQTIEASRDRQLTFKNEIDVRGMRADEAIQAVTYFIDDALQFNAGRVRILHGTGTGALRVALRRYLDTVPGVTSYHDEDVRFGGAGITVVEL